MSLVYLQCTTTEATISTQTHSREMDLVFGSEMCGEGSRARFAIGWNKPAGKSRGLRPRGWMSTYRGHSFPFGERRALCHPKQVRQVIRRGTVGVTSWSSSYSKQSKGFPQDPLTKRGGSAARPRMLLIRHGPVRLRVLVPSLMITMNVTQSDKVRMPSVAIVSRIGATRTNNPHLSDRRDEKLNLASFMEARHDLEERELCER